MQLLTLSDVVVPAIYSPQIRQMYCDVDLVLSCGDLPYYYLEYVTTLLPADVAYVLGNHDAPVQTSHGTVITRPRGCISLEGRTLELNGLLLAGLGGSMRYRPGAMQQYSEAQMRARILGLIPRLLANRLRYGRYLDILVTHSPPFGIHDASDRAHTGFKSFLTFMRYFHPVYLLHGHKHRYRWDVQERTRYEETTVINVFPKRIVHWPPRATYE